MNDERVPQTDPSSDEDARRPHTVGVLFVHGIGQQRRGDTLVAFGEPLQRWIARWQTKSKLESLATTALIRVDEHDPTAPAHAVVDVPVFGGDDRTESWMMAEAWWAASFTTPTYGSLFAWGLQVMPWVTITHFANRTRRQFQRLRESELRVPTRAARMASFAVEMILLVAAFLVLVPVVTLSVILVLVLGLIPVPRFRRVVGAIQRGISNTIGDSFTLTASPIQSAAIRTQIHHDLGWLLDRCDRVAIVAHSQGAAIAHEVLADARPDRVDLLVTYGSGLNKLLAIRRAREIQLRNETTLRAPMGFWLGLVGLGGVAAATWWGVVELLAEIRDGDGEGAGPLMVGLVGAMLFAFGVIAASAKFPVDVSKVDLRPITWRDFYSSTDPVPNGTLTDSLKIVDAETELDMSDLESIVTSDEIVNSRSVLRDHTAYWRADDDFVWRVATELEQLERSSVTFTCSELDRVRLRVAAHRRRWRTRWLTGMKVLAAAAVMVVPLFQLDDLRDFVDPVRTRASVNISEGGWAHSSLAIAQWCVCVLVAYGIVYFLFRWWTVTDVQRMFVREQVRTFGAHNTFAAMLYLLAVGVVATVTVAVGQGDRVPSAVAVGLGVTVGLSFAAFIPAAAFAAALDGMQRRGWLGPPRLDLATPISWIPPSTMVALTVVLCASDDEPSFAVALLTVGAVVAGVTIVALFSISRLGTSVRTWARETSGAGSPSAVASRYSLSDDIAGAAAEEARLLIRDIEMSERADLRPSVAHVAQLATLVGPKDVLARDVLLASAPHDAANAVALATWIDDDAGDLDDAQLTRLRDALRHHAAKGPRRNRSEARQALQKLVNLRNAVS